MINPEFLRKGASMQNEQSFTQLVASRIKEIRTDNSMTQEELGKHLKITRQQVTRLESGQQAISTERITQIAKIFQLTPLALIAPQTRDDGLPPEAAKILAEFKEFLIHKYRPKR
jgi:transcriptional regulator with XRE-family HTH domain